MFRRLSAIGVRAGWRRIDAGAGAGSVARCSPSASDPKAACGRSTSTRRLSRLRPGWRSTRWTSCSRARSSTWAGTCLALLDRRGLVEVRAEVDLPLVRGGSPMAEFYSMSFAQLSTIAAAGGAAPALIDAARAEFADPTRWFHGPAIVAAWGTVPESSS